MIRNLLLFGLLLTLMPGTTQTIEQALEGVDGTDFFEIQKRLNSYFEIRPGAPGYKQWKRREWFLEPRLYPTGEMKNLSGLAVVAYNEVAKQSQNSSRSTHGGWYFMGPSDWVPGFGGNAGMGRLNCVVVHPSDEDIIYVGASTGGIWKTTNGGSNWTNVSPHLPILAIADIALDPDNPNIVYALTGDGDPLPGETSTHSQSEVSSFGIIRSTNGGASWFPTGFALDHPSIIYPYKLLMHPNDANIQFITCDDGIYKTIDGWDTNDKVLNGNFYDIEFHPANPLIMYCSSSARIRRSSNMGDDWDIVLDGNTYSVLDSSTRIELAVSPASTGYVYAMGGDWAAFEFLVRSTDTGLNWTIRDTSGSPQGKFATYCIGLAVDPNDVNDVYGGMQWITRSFNGGLTWTQVNQDIVHADIHDVKVTDAALYVACDGGLYKSTDQGDSWTDLSPGLAITEIYRIAGTPDNTSLFYCGVQDNGTLRRTNSGTFTAVNGSDGTVCRINYNNSDTVYSGSQNGTWYRSIDAGASFQTMSVPGDGSAWISPMIMDPVNPRVLFFGKDSLYRCTTGGAPYTYIGMPTGDEINVLAQGTSNRNRLYISSEGSIYRSDNALGGSVSYTNVTNGLPDLFITDIAVDPANSLRVFITFSGYTAGEKVYFTTDGGVTWDNMSDALPNTPANCIEYISTNPNIDAMYIGTDIGVFYRDDNLGDWIYFSNGMPSVQVNDLYSNPGGTIITAGTYGRGLWQSTGFTGCIVNVVHSDIGDPLGGVIYRSASSTISSTAEFRNDIGTEVYYTAGDRITLNPGFRLRTQAFFEAKIGDCPSIGLPLASPEAPNGIWLPFEEKEMNVNWDR